MTDKKVDVKARAEKSIYLQFRGQEVAIAEVLEDVMKDYDEVKQGGDPAEDIKIYLKPEDARAYYVINNDYAGDVIMHLR